MLVKKIHTGLQSMKEKEMCTWLSLLLLNHKAYKTIWASDSGHFCLLSTYSDNRAGPFTTMHRIQEGPASLRCFLELLPLRSVIEKPK